MEAMLMIDDDESICYMCERELGHKGYTIRSVLPGAEAY